MTATAQHTLRPAHPVEALFDAADRFPDRGEGSRWHVCNETAHAYRADYEACVLDGDRSGARECVLDALDMLVRWTTEVSQ